MVVDLIEHQGCQVNSLVGYFGEKRDKPCGHCTWCLTKQSHRVEGGATDPIRIEEAEILGLRDRCPPELRTPRQIAKILCGLTSPAFTKARLNREQNAGRLAADPWHPRTIRSTHISPDRTIAFAG